jgi:hypothetical protein
LSYVVSIRRDSPITEDDLRLIVESDPDFHLPESPGNENHSSIVMYWQSDGQEEPVSFVLNDGLIEVTTPSDSALRKMQSLAKLLDAKVIGEESEDLTTAEIVDTRSSGCGQFVWTVAIIVILLVLFWTLRA